MGEVAPNASFHYWGLGVLGDEVEDGKYAQCKVLTRGLDFESGNEIETETDEGHTGGANLDMGSYRSSAESQPAWNDAIRYGEGIEDIFYLMLGSVNRTNNTNNIEGIPYKDDSGSAVDGVYTYSYEFPPLNAPQLPYATIYNGYAKTVNDARVFNNCVLNEIEFTFSNTELPRYDVTFVSDYNNFNMKNPSRTMPAKSIFAKPKQVNLYIGNVGDDEATMLGKKVGCFTESSFSINNNFETQICQDDVYGKNNKQMGVRETEGSIEMSWSEKSKGLEPEYEGGLSTARVVSTEMLYKQIWYEIKGIPIGATNVPYSTLIKFPEAEITKVESPLSGDEAKTLSVEYKVLETPARSFMTVDVVTHLSKLNVDETGVAFNTLYEEAVVSP